MDERLCRALLGCLAVLPTAHVAHGEPLQIATAEALVAALESGPRDLRLRKGTYTIDRTLALPDGTRLIGEGVMRYDEEGLPRGFEPGTATVIRAVEGFAGDVLVLGNGARLRGLVVQGADDRGSEHGGNVVVLSSRAPNDRIEGAIAECEIVNPNPQGFTDTGPKGHAVLLVTHNVRGTAHVGATVQLQLERTIVRASSRGGGAMFAINFATHGSIALTLRRNRVEGGPLYGTAAASRPDPVDHAHIRIDSEQNRYVGGNEAGSEGWTFYGGSSSPHVTSDVPNGPSFNSISVRSSNDRIEDVAVGITAIGARRIPERTGPLSDNGVELDLENLVLDTVGPDSADLALRGTLLHSPSSATAAPLEIGPRNAVHLRMRGVTGSGSRANVYSPGEGRIAIEGDPAAFVRDNPQIDPAPPRELFVGAP